MTKDQKFTVKRCYDNINIASGTHYVVDNKGDYLYPDGIIRTICHITDKKHGWYSSKEDADKAIELYNSINNQDSKELIALAKESLSYFINHGLMFTAFDVTTKAREDNPTVRIDHAVVKSYVSDQFTKGGLVWKNANVNYNYERMLSPVGKPEPWLYYIGKEHNPEHHIKQNDKPAVKITATFNRITFN